MRRALDRIDRDSRGDSPLHRLDARWKLLGTLALVMTVALAPVGQWPLLIGAGVLLAFLIGLSTLSPAPLVREWLTILPVVLLLALVMSPGHPAREEYGVWSVGLTLIARNALAVLTVLLLTRVTPLSELIRGLARLGTPRILLSSLQLMTRYLYVLADEFDRMVLARRSRTFRRSGITAWRSGASLIAALFLRTFERGERVHAAMLARGWDGGLRSLGDPES